MDVLEEANKVPENNNAPTEAPEEEEGDTIENHSSDHSSSGDECESGDEEDIMADIRNLMKRDKVEVLAEVIKSRTEQLRLRQKIKVYQYALDDVGGQKTQLELDLALSTKMLLALQEGLAEQHKRDEKILNQINMTSEFLGDLDLKRVQLIKETRQFAAQLNSNKEQMEEMVQKRTQEGNNRCSLLQSEIETLTTTNQNLQHQILEINKTNQSLVSSLSERSNEVAKLTDELHSVQKRNEFEVQSNATLKTNIDMILAEKTQLSTEIIRMENRMTEVEADKEAALAQMERLSNEKLFKLEQLQESKLNDLDNAWKNKYEEEMKKVDAMITTLKSENDIGNKNNAMLHTTIEKLRSELLMLHKQLEQEKEQEKKMDHKIGDVETTLENRDREISALNEKLQNEQLRCTEQSEQIAVLEETLRNITNGAEAKVQTLESQLQHAQADATKSKITNEKLNQDLSNYVLKINSFESLILERNKELTILKEKLADAEKTQVLLDSSQKANKQDNIRVDDEKRNDQPSGTKITSTPLRPSDLVSSLDIPASKKTRMNDYDRLSVTSSISNYTSFQGDVDRKRDLSRFFMRKSPTHVMAKHESKTFFRRASRSNSEDDMISLNSTVNLDEEPLEIMNITNSSSPVPLVKPFFRRQSEKK